MSQERDWLAREVRDLYTKARALEATVFATPEAYVAAVEAHAEAATARLRRLLAVRGAPAFTNLFVPSPTRRNPDGTELQVRVSDWMRETAGILAREEEALDAEEYHVSKVLSVIAAYVDALEESAASLEAEAAVQPFLFALRRPDGSVYGVAYTHASAKAWTLLAPGHSALPLYDRFAPRADASACARCNSTGVLIGITGTYRGPCPDCRPHREAASPAGITKDHLMRFAERVRDLTAEYEYSHAKRDPSVALPFVVETEAKSLLASLAIPAASPEPGAVAWNDPLVTRAVVAHLAAESINVEPRDWARSRFADPNDPVGAKQHRRMLAAIKATGLVLQSLATAPRADATATPPRAEDDGRLTDKPASFAGLALDVLACIPADWSPNQAREWGKLGPILAEFIDDLREGRYPAPRADATAGSQFARRSIPASGGYVCDERGVIPPDVVRTMAETDYNHEQAMNALASLIRSHEAMRDELAGLRQQHVSNTNADATAGGVTEDAKDAARYRLLRSIALGQDVDAWTRWYFLYDEHCLEASTLFDSRVDALRAAQPEKRFLSGNQVMRQYGAAQVCEICGALTESKGPGVRRCDKHPVIGGPYATQPDGGTHG